MAEALSLQAVVKLVGSLTNALDLSTPSDSFSKDYTITFGNGTGINQGNMLWHDQSTLAASAAETHDLSGGLTSVFGTAIVFTVIKGLVVYAAPANTNNVQVTRPASEGVTIFLAAGDGLSVRPGGLFVWIDPTAAGIAIGAGASDDLTFTNSSGGTGVTYDIWIWGEV